MGDNFISEREFWLLVRMALIQMVKAIEKRWLCKDAPTDRDCIDGEKVV